jgi:Mn-dependent DtxR family transcriptional regulator
MARTLFNKIRLVRRLTVAHSFAEAETQDHDTWRRMTPLQRLKALELWRQMNHQDYDPDTARIPRVLEFVEQASR